MIDFAPMVDAVRGMLFPSIIVAILGLGFVIALINITLRKGVNHRAWNRAKGPNLRNYSNQIKFIEEASLYSRNPITYESFKAVYAVLDRSLEKEYRILAEVSLGSFIRADSNLAFRSINSKRVDFLIIDASGDPQLAIEYHGSGHFQGNAKARDAVKRLIFRKVGIPLLEFKEGVSADNVRDEVNKIIQKEAT